MNSHISTHADTLSDKAMHRDERTGKKEHVTYSNSLCCNAFGAFSGVKV